MAIINIRESLNKMDKDTDCKYDLVNLYESLPLTDEEQKDIVKMLYSNEEPEVIYNKIKEKYPLVQFAEDDDISELEDNYRDDLKYTLLATKTVYDSNGFTTDYTWYKDNKTGNNVFVFGDMDYYRPEDGYFDYETENDKVAQEWFNSYNGFEDELDESCDKFNDKLGLCVDCGYDEKSYENTDDCLNESVKKEYTEEDKKHLIDDLVKRFFTEDEAKRIVNKDVNYAENLAYGNVTTEDFIEALKWLNNLSFNISINESLKEKVYVDNDTVKELISKAPSISSQVSRTAWVSKEYIKTRGSRIILNIPISKDIDSVLATEAETRARKMYDTNDVWWDDYVLQVDVTDWFDDSTRTEPVNESVEEDELEVADQKISSAKTSINAKQLPAIFRLAKFKPNTINLDMGGGKFDNAAEELAKADVTNLVYDPYNRTQEHNNEVVSQIRKNGGADTATISNVLNVIAEPEARQTVLRNTKKLLKPNGTVYITVYEGDKSGEGRETSSGYQLNKPTKDYVEEIEKVFPNVQRRGKLIIAN